MKKSLLAVAAMTAFAGAAQAQSSVTVYGILDVAAQSTSVMTQANSGTKTNVAYSGMTNSTLAGSRLGFKGTEDVGGGTKVNFVTEMSLNVFGDSFGQKYDLSGVGTPATNTLTGTTTANSVPGVFNRQTWLGMSNAKLGEIRGGYMHNLQYDFNTGYTEVYEGAAGGRNHLDVIAANQFTSNADGIANKSGESTRLQGINYYLPTLINGLSVKTQYGNWRTDTYSGTATAVNYQQQNVAANVEYNWKGLNVGYSRGNATAVSNGAAGAAYLSTLTPIAASSNIFGARYDAGFMRVSAMYGNRTATVAGSNPVVNVKISRIGVSAPIPGAPALRVFAGYGTSKTNEATALVQDRKLFQTGVLYSLSKRSTLFALYGQDTDNHSLAGTSAGGAYGINATAGAPTDAKTMRLGLSHTF